MQANALIPINGRVVIFVARLSAERLLVLSSFPSSVKPAVLLSVYSNKMVFNHELLMKFMKRMKVNVNT